MVCSVGEYVGHLKASPMWLAYSYFTQSILLVLAAGSHFLPRANRLPSCFLTVYKACCPLGIRGMFVLRTTICGCSTVS